MSSHPTTVSAQSITATCPRCGAAPGEKCKGTALGVHTDRYFAANPEEAAAWSDAVDKL